jgi:hypothetical protein
MRTHKWALIYLVLVSLTALGTSLWTRWGASETCEMDGQAIPASLRVDLTTADGARHAFCSIECARRWLAKQPVAQCKEAVVRDALTGEPLDAYVAFFVESEAVTNRSNGNKIHAFRLRTEAMDHILRFHGREVEDPFQTP